MDKAEAKKEISQLRQKRQNAIDDARITYLEGFIDGQKELEQYAQQVSREVAVEFYISHLNYPIDRIHITKNFDEWYSNHQNKQ